MTGLLILFAVSTVILLSGTVVNQKRQKEIDRALAIEAIYSAAYYAIQQLDTVQLMMSSATERHVNFSLRCPVQQRGFYIVHLSIPIENVSSGEWSQDQVAKLIYDHIRSRANMNALKSADLVGHEVYMSHIHNREIA